MPLLFCWGFWRRTVRGAFNCSYKYHALRRPGVHHTMVSTIPWCPPWYGVHPTLKQQLWQAAWRQKCSSKVSNNLFFTLFFVEIISCKKVQVNCVWIESRQIMTGCDHWYGRQQKRREIGSKSYNLVTISPWLQNLGRTGDLFTETIFWFKLLSYLKLISENRFVKERHDIF